MVEVYRDMRADEYGMPEQGPSARMLGARPGVDIRVFQADGRVWPGLEGLSVAPNSPYGLPRHRRPWEFDGTGKDPVFVLDTDALPDELEYRPDPNNPDGHGLIVPAYVMTFEHYQQALYDTRQHWRLVE